MAKQPTPEQWSALLDYANKYGRTWKDSLCNAWFNGRDSLEPKGPLLRQIRNQFGPRWLARITYADLERATSP
jgi:hypothetical protein